MTECADLEHLVHYALMLGALIGFLAGAALVYLIHHPMSDEEPR